MARIDAQAVETSGRSRARMALPKTPASSSQAWVKKAAVPPLQFARSCRRNSLDDRPAERAQMIGADRGAVRP
jgi:hypothetical protein